MHKITFTCETITPMFLVGADGQTPELRAPSIKGALRFWWRALNGHLVEKKDGKWDYSKLKEEEGNLFGNTNKKSCLLIRVKVLDEKIGADNLDNEIRYMAYGAHERSYFDIETKFEVIIRSQDKTALENMRKVFSLLTHLGGLGAKSRNGFGAFFCNEVDDFDTICKYNIFKKMLEVPYTNLNNLTEFYISNNSFSPYDWQSPIKELKYLYADVGKKSINSKKDRVHIAAPYNSIKIPERHPKLYFMSLIKIKNQLRYIITFMPYEYLDSYPNLNIEDHKKMFNKWLDTTELLTSAIVKEKRKGKYLINPVKL